MSLSLSLLVRIKSFGKAPTLEILLSKKLSCISTLLNQPYLVLNFSDTTLFPLPSYLLVGDCYTTGCQRMKICAPKDASLFLFAAFAKLVMSLHCISSLTVLLLGNFGSGFPPRLTPVLNCLMCILYSRPVKGINWSLQVRIVIWATIINILACIWSDKNKFCFENLDLVPICCAHDYFLDLLSGNPIRFFWCQR